MKCTVMKRVIVIGCPGGGKSTFAKRLSALTGLPLFHLDMLYWKPDKTTVSKAVFRERLSKVLTQDLWIIDGNYGSTMELRLQACDTVFFLDYPMSVCLEGVLSRRGKPRDDLPWVEDIDELDESFISYVKAYDTDSRPSVLALLSRYPDKQAVIFSSRGEADAYLMNLGRTYDG